VRCDEESVDRASPDEKELEEDEYILLGCQRAAGMRGGGQTFAAEKQARGSGHGAATGEIRPWGVHRRALAMGRNLRPEEVQELRPWGGLGVYPARGCPGAPAMAGGGAGDLRHGGLRRCFGPSAGEVDDRGLDVRGQHPGAPTAAWTRVGGLLPHRRRISGGIRRCTQEGEDPSVLFLFNEIFYFLIWTGLSILPRQLYMWTSHFIMAVNSCSIPV
jgi:hypothetical protein